MGLMRRRFRLLKKRLSRWSEEVMNFNTDIFNLKPPISKSFTGVGSKFPNNIDYFYRAKQIELLQQYNGARIFLRETETTDWSHYFSIDNNDTDEETKIMYKGYLYETALYFYNVVIDVSWTLCYSSLEFACTQNGNRVNTATMSPIDEAYDLLRSVEKNATNPTAKENPFAYLRTLDAEYKDVIDYIILFWEKIKDTELRKKYNYCKHRGKPLYKEQCQFNSTRFFDGYLQHSNGEMIQLVSDVSDVQYKISLEESIEELRMFDDEELFPYIEGLFPLLEKLINLSPMV